MEKDTFLSLKCLLKDICSNFEKEISEFNITGQQARIIIFLNKNEKIHQNDIEKHFGLSKSTVSGLIKRLIKKDLVVSKKDLLTNLITPTNKAKDIYAKILAARKKLDQKLTEGFEKEDIALLSNYIKKMKNNMEDLKNA